MPIGPHFDIDLEQFWRDPYPALAELRDTAPIAFVPQLGATLITTRDDISACEKNVQIFSSDQPGGLMNVLMGQNMMRRDGEAHQAERKVYYPAIAPKLVREYWAAEFEAHTTQILDDIGSAGSADLVQAYAMPVSAEALKSMTGLTNMAFKDMDASSQAMIDGISNYAGDGSAEARCHVATARIDAAIDDRLPAVRRSPDCSLLSVMLESGMPIENIRANIKLTISGGQNEPRDAIAGGIWALLTHPDQLALVRDGKATWGQVFEEYCRWISPIGMSPRRVANRYERGGMTFEEDDRVFLMYGSANRDKGHFENPDVFDVTRNTKKSLAFGAGPHFCAGSAASRSLVGDIALPMIFDRLQGLCLDESAEQPRFGGWAFRGLISLPTRF